MASFSGAMRSLGLGLIGAPLLSNLMKKAPAPAAPPPVPNAAVDAQVADTARLQAEAAQRVRAAGALGRRATLLTGPSGVAAPPPVQRKTLLGQ